MINKDSMIYFYIIFFILFYISRMSASIMYRKIFTDMEENFNTNNNKNNIPLFLSILPNWDIHIPDVYKEKKRYKYNLGLILQVQNKFGTTTNIDFI